MSPRTVWCSNMLRRSTCSVMKDRESPQFFFLSPYDRTGVENDISHVGIFLMQMLVLKSNSYINYGPSTGPSREPWFKPWLPAQCPFYSVNLGLKHRGPLSSEPQVQPQPGGPWSGSWRRCHLASQRLNHPALLLRFSEGTASPGEQREL